MALQAVDISSGQVSGVDSLSSASSSVINWETDESGINRPRAALSAYSATNAGNGASIGLCRWKNYVINVTSDRYVRVLSDAVPDAFSVASSATTSTQVGGTASRVTFAIGDSYVYMAGGGQIQRWATLATPPDTLTSAPTLSTHVAVLGQRLIANDKNTPNFFYWSDIGEGAWTSWPAANTAAADARPDPIVALAETGSELFIWGTETVQCYAVGSDPTLPFDLVNSIDVGIAAPYAYCRLAETGFVFLDDRRRVVSTDGREITVLSDAIQKSLNDLTTISDCWFYREVRGQHSSLVVRFPSETRTFVYDLKGQKWGERKYYLAPFQSDFPVSAHVYWPAYNYNLVGSSLSSVGLLRFDETSRQDIGGPLVCERTTGWQDFGTTARKRSTRTQVVMRRGTAAQGATPGALELRVQNDDGPWSPWQQVSVGTPDDYAQVMECRGTNGIFRRRRYGLRYSTSEDHSLVSLKDDVTELAS